MKTNLRNIIKTLLAGQKVKIDLPTLSEQEIRELLVKRNIKPSKIDEATKALLDQGFSLGGSNSAPNNPNKNQEEILAEIERLEKALGWK